MRELPESENSAFYFRRDILLLVGPVVREQHFEGGVLRATVEDEIGCLLRHVRDPRYLPLVSAKLPLAGGRIKRSDFAAEAAEVGA